MTPTPKNQIFNLITTLLLGFLSAIFLVIVMTSYYAKENIYLAKNAAISPNTLMDMESPSSKMKVKNILYKYKDFENDVIISKEITNSQYASFYKLIENDSSLTTLPADLAADFNQLPVSALEVSLNYKGQEETPAKIEFLYKGNYYRILLRDSKNENWVYFYHPDIYAITKKLF